MEVRPFCLLVDDKDHTAVIYFVCVEINILDGALDWLHAPDSGPFVHIFLSKYWIENTLSDDFTEQCICS